MQVSPAFRKHEWQNLSCLSTLRPFRYIRPISVGRISLYLIFFAVTVIFSSVMTAPAVAISLEGDPYIKAPPYKPPPLPISPNISLPGNINPSQPESHVPYNPPAITYRPRPSINPRRASQHDLWCRQNHPSYRATDNSYHPFDRSGALSPQARVPCISPYN